MNDENKKRTQRWKGFLEPSVLKHKAFDYEDEVRVALRFGWEPSLRSRLNETRNSVLEAANGSMEILRAFKSLKSVTQPDIEETNLKFYSAPTPEGMIAAAFIDPSAQAHKQDFIANYLHERGVEVKNSEAFGLSYRGLGAYPDKPFIFI